MSSTDNNKSVSKGKLYKGVEFNSFYGNKAKKEPDIIVNADFVEKLLNEAKKELQTTLTNISKNSEEMTTRTKEEEILKALVLAQTVMLTYADWVKKWFGDVP